MSCAARRLNVNGNYTVSLTASRWNDPKQCLVPVARGQYQEGRGCGFPQGAQGTLEATAAGDMGWFEGASKPVGS